ncbi:PQQ-dependent sugar dehydrogenase [Pseudenhygromyxa sp. WMMC2535]|uniref:PQQ-dependent sugar dehydrogenase n=1 Tax=Pseudenhygromyxa sp. WMMC2535 TaxID=2712867 RepID=UPI001555FD13|nr:PQQ-dependent sugar dehydrogenase [Pseudenhygromyxa sp. WMMC2535]NVB37094.1 PQQ-dependent sugar dehydrogenase [Pseudenhygromyxa sp. WMMC2535]
MRTRLALTLTPSLTVALALFACGDSGSSDEEIGESGSSTTADTGTDSSTGDTSESGSTSAGESGSETADTDSETDTDTGTTGEDIPPCPYEPVDGDPEVELELVAENLSAPTFVIGHPEQPDRLFVTLKSGTVVIVEPGSTTANAEPFLSVEVSDFSEMGLLSMDFHPDFPEDPRVYVHYSPSGELRSRVSEFSLDPENPDAVDPDSERIIYEKSQPLGNHNGGQVAFGPDGYLYFSIGDGGDQGDPNNRAQDLSTYFGKIMRVDITPSGDEGYSIPADNPFVDDADVLPEIWAYGLRNPWRFGWDPATGWMYAGDVGQNAWEELDIIEPGKNYGWRPMEGNHCYGQDDCDTTADPNTANVDGYIAPIYDYGGAQRSISAGYVYHSCEVPAWDGRYFFADYVLNSMWALVWDGQSVDFLGEVAQPENISTFGTNAWGDVYLAETILGLVPPHPESSRIWRVAPAG